LKGLNQSSDLPILAVTVEFDILSLQTGHIVTLQEVPEPSAVYPVLGGFGSLLAFRRRRR